MKKIRWEDKVFNWILRKRRRGLTQYSNENNAIYVDQKIIYKKPVNNKIIIHSNRFGLKKMAFYNIGIFLLLLYVFLNFKNWDYSNLFLVLLITWPLFIYGVYYYYKSTGKIQPWRIDLKRKKIILTTIAIPFERIDHFSITRLIDPGKIMGMAESDYSYHLNLNLTDKNQITLFTDEHKSSIEEAANFLSNISGIRLDDKITNA